MLKSYDVLIFYNFTIVEIQMSVPLELVKNWIILLREGWWLKVSVGQQQIIFLVTLWCTTHRKISVFTTPVTSFYIRNQDPLLTDIHLLQGTFFLPQKLGTACSTKCFSEKKRTIFVQCTCTIVWPCTLYVYNFLTKWNTLVCC